MHYICRIYVSDGGVDWLLGKCYSLTGNLNVWSIIMNMREKTVDEILNRGVIVEVLPDMNLSDKGF